jgi:serine/threonine protein kinase
MEAQITVEGQIKLMQHKKKGTEDKEKDRRRLLGQIRQLERERTQIRFSLTEAKSLFPHLASMIREQVESIEDEFLARRTRQDYSDRERLSQTVLKAVDPDGQPCVLKSFLLDSKASDKFHTEIEILRKLSHLRSPLVVPIQLVFIDDGIGYIQMPFYEMGDMEKWLSTGSY